MPDNIVLDFLNSFDKSLEFRCLLLHDVLDPVWCWWSEKVRHPVQLRGTLIVFLTPCLPSQSCQSGCNLVPPLRVWPALSDHWGSFILGRSIPPAHSHSLPSSSMAPRAPQDQHHHLDRPRLDPGSDHYLLPAIYAGLGEQADVGQRRSQPVDHRM